MIQKIIDTINSLLGRGVVIGEIQKTDKNNFNIVLKISVKKKKEYYLANSPAFNLTDFGNTSNEAIKNLKNAVELFLETCMERGTLKQALVELGWEKEKKIDRFLNFALCLAYAALKILMQWSYFCNKISMFYKKVTTKYIALKNNKVIDNSNSKAEVVDYILKNNHRLGDFLIHLVSNNSNLIRKYNPHAVI